MGGIEYAAFRTAKREEVQYAKGGLAWQCRGFIWDGICRILGTFHVAWKGPNVLAWNTPFPQQWAERFSHWLGLYPEQPYVQKLFTFFGDRYFVDDKKIMDALFAHHRNDSVFESTNGIYVIYELLKQIFPDDNLSEEDFMFTCQKENTKLYREVLHALLNKTSVKQATPMIQETVEKTLEEWNQCSLPVNATEQTRLFTSRVVTKLMFGTDEVSKEICESVNFINGYVIKQIVRKVTDADKKTFADSIQIFRKAVQTILDRQDIPLFKQNHDLTFPQKKALIFMIFFAGQETTASLLNYMLWQIALKPDLQEGLHETVLKGNEKGVKNYFNYAFHQFNPAYGTGRKLKEDTCLEYRIEGEKETRKVILFKGKNIAAHISRLAKKVLVSNNYNDWLPFAAKVHRCPGDQLAVQEIKQFITTLVANYEIETQQKKPIPVIGLVTAQLAEDVYITLKPREKTPKLN